VYVGLEPVTVKNEVTFGFHQIYGFDSRNTRYAFLVASEETDEELELLGKRVSKRDALSSEISRMGAVLGLERRSYRIHVLSEFSPRMGGNWSGAFASALAGALLADNGRLDAETIASWSSMPAWELDRLDSFRDCNRLAWHFETVLHGGKASGYGTFCAIVGSAEPMCYLTEPRSDVGDGPPIDVVRAKQSAHRWDSYPTWLEKIAYSGFRFRDVSPKLTQPEMVFGLLTTGVPRDTGSRIERAAGLAAPLEDARLAARQLLLEDRETILRHLPRGRSALERLLEATDGSALLGQYYESLSVAGLETFHVVRGLFEGRAGSEALVRLARVLTGAQGSLMQLGQNWALGEALISACSRVADQLGLWDRVGIKLTGGGGGGFLFFAGPGGCDLQWKLCEAIDELRERWPHHVAARATGLVWASTEGLEEDGLRIELCRSINYVGSRFAELRSLPRRVLVVGASDAVEERLVYERDVELMISDTDAIFVDHLAPHKYQQLTIAGQPVTSKEVSIGGVATLLHALARAGGSLNLAAHAQVLRTGGRGKYESRDLKHQLQDFSAVVRDRLGRPSPVSVEGVVAKAHGGGPRIYVVERS
jgi:hypothetical protein